MATSSTSTEDPVTTLSLVCILMSEKELDTPFTRIYKYYINISASVAGGHIDRTGWPTRWSADVGTIFFGLFVALVMAVAATATPGRSMVA